MKILMIGLALFFVSSALAQRVKENVKVRTNSVSEVTGSLSSVVKDKVKEKRKK